MNFFLMFYVMGMVSLLVGHADNFVKRMPYSRSGSFFLGMIFLIFIYILYWKEAKNLNFIYSDLITYYSNFVVSQNWNINEFQRLHEFEFGYDLLVWIFAKICLFWEIPITHYEFTLIIFGLSLLIIFFACSQLFTGGMAALITTTYMWYQYFNLFSFNIVRQGLALAICLLAITIYLRRNRLYVSFLVMIVACSFHQSILYTGLVPLLIIAGFSNNRIKFQKVLEIITLITAALYLTRVNGSVFSKLPLNLVQAYQDQSIILMAQKGGIVANDPKLLFMTGIMLCMMKFLANDNIVLQKIYYIMLIVSIEFFLMGFVLYSYRIAYSAFFLIPFGLFLYIEKNIYTHKSLVLISIVAGIIIFSWEATPFYMLQ